MRRYNVISLVEQQAQETAQFYQQANYQQAYESYYKVY